MSGVGSDRVSVCLSVHFIATLLSGQTTVFSDGLSELGVAKIYGCQELYSENLLSWKLSVKKLYSKDLNLFSEEYCFFFFGSYVF